MRELDDVTGAIVDAAVRIHRDLGPGLLESVYEAVLARALEHRGLSVEQQQVIRFEYNGMVFEEGLRIDLMVDSLSPSCVRVSAAPREPIGTVQRRSLRRAPRGADCYSRSRSPSWASLLSGVDAVE